MSQVRKISSLSQVEARMSSDMRQVSNASRKPKMPSDLKQISNVSRSRKSKMPSTDQLKLGPKMPSGLHQVGMGKKRLQIHIKGGSLTEQPVLEEEATDIFSNNQLVESPRRIQFERTQMCVKSPLGEALDVFYANTAQVSEKKLLVSHARVREVMDYLMPRLVKLGYTIGMRIVRYVGAGSTYDDTVVCSALDTELLLVFEDYNCRHEPLETGYKYVPLKKWVDKDGTKPDEYRYGRSEDGLYLSSLLVAKNIHELVTKAVRFNQNIEVEPFTIEDGQSQIVMVFKGKYRISLIPAFEVRKEGVFLTTRPYTHDDNPESDMMWRICFIEKERKIMETIDLADRGTRRKAFKLLKALVHAEHTLHGITSYQLKTILLQSFDADVDNTPRWQKDSLADCFLAMLRQLQQSYAIQNLKHFFLKDFNLIGNLHPRTLNSLKGRLSFLVNNESELIRVIKKRSIKE